MRLSDFIVQRLDDILIAWVDSIRRTVPVAEALGDAALRDNAQAILLAVAQAVAGNADLESLDALTRATCVHAADRVAQGFTLDQMASEFRAVRADVIRRWTDEVHDFSRQAHDEQMRFNDVLDHAVAGSTAHYAARLERARDLFLGVLGHDLRTPLAAISHSASLLRRVDTSAAQRREAIERIAKSAGRMDLMIQDLLDFTRSRLGTQLPVNRVPCSLEELARQVIDELAALHPGVTIALDASGDSRGRWDSERVMQLLSNLVDNAIRHRVGDAPVTVALRGEPDRVAISVHNVGDPIPPSEQKAIFDPLRRGINQDVTPSPIASSAGLGLGLYIARQIAVAHGGDVRLTSTPEDGTRFVATLARGAGEEVGARIAEEVGGANIAEEADERVDERASERADQRASAPESGGGSAGHP
jgi:signal transduction histidine kinase